MPDFRPNGANAVPFDYGRGLGRVWKQIRLYTQKFSDSMESLTGHDHSATAGNGKRLTSSAFAGYAEGGLTGGADVVFVFDLPDHATQNVDFILGPKCRVVDCTFSSMGVNGANANTFQVCKGTIATPISDAISMNGKTQGQLGRAGAVDATNWDIAAGGTLRIVQTKAGGVAAAKAIISAVLMA